MRVMRCGKTNLVVYLQAYIYVVIFFVIFKVNVEDFWYCIIHATISSFTFNYVFKYIESSIKTDKYSLSSMYLFVSTIYLHLSSVKYIVNPLYPGYITEQWLRLLGSCMGAMVICVTAFVWYHWLIKKRKRNIDYKIINQMSINPVLLWSSVIICSGLMIYTALRGYLTRDVESTIVSQISETVTSITLVICALNIKERKELQKFNILNYKGVIPIGIVVVVALFQSLVSGQRHMLITPIIVLLAIMLCLKRVRDFSFVKKVVSILPIAVALFSSIVFLVSGRFQMSDTLFMKNLVYRFDMTDFAITEAERTSFGDYSIKSITEPIQLAIPRIFSKIDKEKIQKDNQYKKILAAADLYINADYNDTVFSMGTEIGGYIGFGAIPLLMMIYYEMLDRWISKRKNAGNICKLAIIPYFCGAENIWQKFVLDTRTYLIIFFVFYIIVLLFMKKNMRRSKKLLQYV